MRLLALLIVAATLLTVPTTNAIYIETPLRVTADPAQAQAGDDVGFGVAPANDSAKERFAGKTLRAAYSYDSSENADDATLQSPLPDVTLGDAATASFRWTIPAELDDRNVFVSLYDGEELVGTVHIAVGDAPPMLMATGGPANDDGAIEPDTRETTQDDATPQANDKQAVPGLLTFGALVAIGLAAYALRRR